MTASRRRKGFTLVELLVVAGLLASFMGFIVAANRPTVWSQVRTLTQVLSSTILAAQTRALGNSAGAALVIDAVPGAIASNGVFYADVPPFVNGTVTGIPPAVLSATRAVGTFNPSNADVTDLANGYMVRFYRDQAPYAVPTAWMLFSSNGSSSGTVAFRTTQTADNTVWPPAPGASPLQFDVARYPASSTVAADTTKFAAIDLRYSGIGDSLSAPWGTLYNGGANGPTAICFNRSGQFDVMVQLAPGSTPALAPTTPTAPLYLLVAALTDIQADRSLQSAASRWLVIAPTTGRIAVAANLPVDANQPVDDGSVRTARTNARQGISGGAK